MAGTSKSQVKKPPQRDPASLTIDESYLKHGETDRLKGANDESMQKLKDELVARALSQPEVRAARAIQRFEGKNLDINACQKRPVKL